MVEKYPVADYTYVVEYEITSSGIYNMRLGALVLDEKYMNFVTTTDSKTPNRDEPQPDNGRILFYGGCSKRYAYERLL